MKKFILISCLLVAFTAVAFNPPTAVVGDTGLVASRVISTKACKIYSITGYNSLATTQYLFVFESSVAPTNGQTGKLGPFAIGASQSYSWDVSYYGADLQTCTAGISTSSVLYTNSATNCTIQGIIAK